MNILRNFKSTKKYFFLIIASFAIILISCKKKTIEDPTGSSEENPTSELTLETSSVRSYQTVYIKSENGIFTSESYSFTIGGQTTNLVVSDSEYAAFIVPNLSPGSVSASVTVNNQLYEFTLSILAHNTITSPEVVIQQSIDNELNFMNNTLLPAINDMDPGSVKDALLSDYNVAQQYITDAQANYSTLSAAEKLVAAQFLEANQPLINDMHSATTDFLSIINNNKSIFDNEGTFNIALTKFVSASVKLFESAPKVAAWAGAGFLLGGPVGAAIGAGIGVGNVLNAFVAYGKAQDEMMSFHPVVDEWLVDAYKSTMIFENQGSKTLSLTGTYNNINAQNSTSAGTKIQGYVQNCTQILNAFNDIMDVIPNALSKTPVLVSQINNVRSKDFGIRSTYLTISGSSNPNVSIQKVVVNDEYKLTFISQSLNDEDFSFTITYNSPGVKSRSQTVNATLINTTTRHYSGGYTIYESESGAPWSYVTNDVSNLNLTGTVFNNYDTSDGIVTWSQGTIMSEDAGSIVLKILKQNDGGGSPLVTLPANEQEILTVLKNGNQLDYENINVQGTYSQKIVLHLELVP